MFTATDKIIVFIVSARNVFTFARTTAVVCRSAIDSLSYNSFIAVVLATISVSEVMPIHAPRISLASIFLAIVRSFCCFKIKDHRVLGNKHDGTDLKRPKDFVRFQSGL